MRTAKNTAESTKMNSSSWNPGLIIIDDYDDDDDVSGVPVIGRSRFGYG
jgi:hypothetical protein